MSDPTRTPDDRETLALHQPVIQGSGGFFTCSCNNWGYGDVRHEGTYAEHLAATLAAAVPEGDDCPVCLSACPASPECPRYDEPAAAAAPTSGQDGEVDQLREWLRRELDADGVYEEANERHRAIQAYFAGLPNNVPKPTGCPIPAPGQVR